MSNTSDIGPGSAGVNPNSSIYEVSAPSTDTRPVKQATGFSSQDTISTAQAAELLAGLMINAHIPALQPPSDSNLSSSLSGQIIDGGSFLLATAKRYQDICTSVTTAWVAQIQKEAKEYNREINDPVNLAKKEDDRASRLGLSDSVQGAVASMQQNHDVDTLSFVTSSLLVSATGVAVTVGVVDVASTSMVAVTPQINQVNSLWSQASAAIPNSMRAELGMIGAWAMGAAFANTFVENVAKSSVKGGGAPDQKSAAKTYAEGVLQLAGSNQLNNAIMALLTAKTEKNQPLTPERKAQMAATVKVILLASALAATYKASTGWITGQEFRDLLSGKMTPKTPLETQLVNALNTQLAQMDLAEKDKVVGSLSRWINTNPDMDELLDAGKSYDSVTIGTKAQQEGLKT